MPNLYFCPIPHFEIMVSPIEDKNYPKKICFKHLRSNLKVNLDKLGLLSIL